MGRIIGRRHLCPTCLGQGTVSPSEMQRLLEDRPGAVGRTHPSTSKNAAKNSIPGFGTQRFCALSALEQFGPLTCAEVADHLGISRNQVATRMGELREGNFVTWYRVDGAIVLRPTGPRDDGRVQEITILGRLVLQRARK